MGRGVKPNHLDIGCRQLFSNKVHWMLEMTEITSTIRQDLTYAYHATNRHNNYSRNNVRLALIYNVRQQENIPFCNEQSN